MNGEVVLDSVILIDHFNSFEEATSYLEKVGAQAAITAITRAEVLTGFASADLPLVVPGRNNNSNSLVFFADCCVAPPRHSTTMTRRGS